MSVSNFLVVNIPTEKVSIKQMAINEVQKKNIKSLNSLFENKNKKKNKVQADIQVPVPLQSVKSHSQKPMESL